MGTVRKPGGLALCRGEFRVEEGAHADIETVLFFTQAMFESSFRFTAKLSRRAGSSRTPAEDGVGSEGTRARKWAPRAPSTRRGCEGALGAAEPHQGGVPCCCPVPGGGMRLGPGSAPQALKAF